QFLTARGVVEQVGVEGGAEESGGDGVDENPLAGPFDGEGSSKRDHSCLAGGVGGHLAERDEGVERGDVDDASVLALEHVFAEDLAGAEGSGEIGVEDALPLVFGKIKRGSAFDLARAIDEDIDLAELS